MRGPLYVGDLTGVRAERDPSIIDPKLKVGSRGSEESLGYWPSYKAATPGQRAQFLEWLAGPREAINEMGYVFLYFYGIERYVLLGAEEDPPEVRAARLGSILKELGRLENVFSYNRSFLGYSARLREAIVIRHAPSHLDRLKEVFPENNSVALQSELARIANNNVQTPLDSDWALQWLFHAGELPRRKNVRANYELLRQLFRGLYEKMGGIKVPKNKTLLRLRYSAASSGLQDVEYYDVPSDWCDPSVLQTPLKPLLPLAETANVALRKLATAEKKESALDFFAAWPKDIPFDPPAKYHVAQKLINAQCRRDSNPTLIAIGIAFRTKVSEKPSKREVRTIRDALSSCGWVLVPDPDLTPCSPKGHDRVWVYQGTAPQNLSGAGRLLDINLRLGAAVALADGEVQEEEIDYVNRLVDAHPDPIERKYFEHCIRWHFAEERSAIGLKAQIDSLGSNEREQLADGLIAIAQADGYLPRQEVLALEKYFARLGLPKDRVFDQLHSRTTEGQSNVLDVETIGPIGATTQQPSVVSLNRQAIEVHRTSTKKIQSVLTDIFEPDADVVDSIEEESLASDAWHEGALDPAHHALAAHLITQSSWSPDDIRQHCKIDGLMFEGAIETINEAAFEYLGDLLIEVDDQIYVNRELMT